MHVYQQVLKRIQTDYVTEPNINDVTTGALHGLLESLDADSSYLTPTEYKIYKDRPATGVAQIGITVSKRFGYATVVNVLPGSPADKEHLTDGDVIESIGDQSTRELSLAVIRLHARRQAGHDGHHFAGAPAQARSRQADADPHHRSRSGADGAAVRKRHHSLSQARRSSPRPAWMKWPPRSRPPRTARSCSICATPPAATPDEGLRLANFFIKQGTLATLEGQKFPSQTFTADPAKFLTDAPLAVLVNRGTYGAAELTAAAIEGAKRGDVVGERTFGEGSVQKTIELPDGAALLLTVAKYEGPDGKKIQDEAVTPTVQVGQAPDDEATRNPPAKGDEPLNKALQLLKAKNS